MRIPLSTPLGNLGSGVLLAFTQPVRLGDRITVGEHTGAVKEITLSYTTRLTMDFGGTTLSWEGVFSSAPPATTVWGYIKVVTA